jgi:threonine/homoserine/homoserine lactone efflux protein
VLDPAVLPGFLTAVVLVSVAPGPDNAYIAAVALAHGARAGLVSAVGMSLGMVVHVCAVTLGLAVLLQSSTWALTAIQVVGAGYLGWLAFSTLREARHGGHGELARPDRHVLRRAVLTNLTNPKVILFFVAFLPQFTRDGHGPVAVQLLCLGLVFLLVGLVCDSAIGLSVGRLGSVLKSGSRAATALTTVAGLTFATLAALLVAEVVRG